jgi:ubiquinone/menaquinone biosynthesis C-methylase UbiE
MSSGELPFADETFDVVYASLSLHYFDEETTNLIFKEIYRILKPGGILAYITNPISDPQTKTYKKIDECFFEDPERLKKRYFTVDYAKQKAKGLFEILLANDQGKALDPKKPGNLMQFIGKKK